jgi:glycosyl hydrolase family 26
VRRRHRLLLTATLLLGGLAGVSLLTALGAATEGPLSGLVTSVATVGGSLEHRLSRLFSGPGRSANLSWFQQYRTNPEQLRKPDVVLLGAFDGWIPRSLDGAVKFEQQIGTTLPLIQLYTAWGDKPDQQFPVQIATAISDMGSVPVITWEPWLTDFESALHPTIPLREARERHGMAAVARGDYDFYIDKWASEAAKFGRPILLRFGHEMNDPYRYPWGPQNNTKEEYIAAWRHVVNRFRHDRANAVIWIWSPHVAYQYWQTYYPGNEYVDWVATGVLNYGPIAQWSKWWSFQEIFGESYPKLALFGKPIMIAEFGSLSFGGDRAAWYRDALADFRRRFPAVRAILFFNVKFDQSATQQIVDWTFADDTLTLGVVARATRALSQGSR